MGGHRRLPEGNDRGARGDHHDHAELDRDLGRTVTSSVRAGRSRTRRTRPRPIRERSPRAPTFPSSGAARCCKASTIGFFVAIAALVVFWLILNRTTLGYEVRAVGFNPEAAAYGGIDVKKKYIQAMAISGAFAGLAGALDMLGYLFQFGVLDVQASQIGFFGIAVALLGRNTAVGTGIAAFLFGGLLYGTTRGLIPNVFDPSLAGNLTSMIQGLIVLFVGADVSSSTSGTRGESCECGEEPRRLRRDEPRAAASRDPRGHSGRRRSPSPASFSASLGSGARCHRSRCARHSCRS